MNTYNDLYLNARRKLRAAGISAYDLEARLIVAFASGKTREEFLSASRYFVTDSAIPDKIEDMIKRRLEGEPVAYIVGEWEFYGIPLVVNRTVMIPRTDTEVLAEAAIRLLRQKTGKIRMLDLCAGCGAIGLAIAANVPDCRIVLADNSEQALAVCRMNMLGNNLSRNVTAVFADIFETPPALLGTFDAIVCNPPYIPTGDLDNLDDSVRSYEPIAALDGGTDGLDYYRTISKNWPVLLKRGGHLAFECGIGQSAAVRNIMRENAFSGITVHFDTLGIERVIVGKLT